MKHICSKNNSPIESDGLYIKDRSETWRDFLKILMLFFLVFSIHFTGLSWYASPRLAVIVLVCVAAFIKKPLSVHTAIKINDLVWILTLIFLLVYAWLIVVINDVSEGQLTVLASMSNFIVLVGVLPAIIVLFFKNTAHFCRCLLMATTIQAVIVFSSFLSLGVRVFLESIQNVEMYRYTWRIIGLGVAGSGGSVYLFCGLIAGGYLIIFEKPRTIYYALYILNFIAIAFVGRTGFYAALVLTLVLILFNVTNITSFVKKNLKLLLITMIVISLLFPIISIIGGYNVEVLDYTLRRLPELFNESSTLEKLHESTATVPDLSLETLFGTGIMRGVTNSGLVFDYDGGYIKRYASIGLIACIISYVSFMFYVFGMLKDISKKRKLFIILCLAILYIIEYKEPFMYMLAYPFTLVMLCRLLQKDQRQSRCLRRQYG